MSFFNRDCAKITAGRCPHCDDDKSCGHGWTLGRQEGAGRNMLCPQCHMEYNVVILDSGECAFCQESVSRAARGSARYTASSIRRPSAPKRRAAKG